MDRRGPSIAARGSFHARPGRGPRAARGASRPRDRPRRGARPAAHRPAGLRQDPARSDGSEPPAAARRRVGDGRVHRGLRGRRRPTRRASPAPAVPRAPSHGQLCRDGRRRPAALAGRGDAREPWRAVPRRAARIRSGRARVPSPAHGGWPCGAGSGRPDDHLPGAIPAPRGDESMPLRVRRCARDAMRVPAGGPGSLPEADLRPAA